MTFLSTMDFLCPDRWLQCFKALRHAILQGFYMQKQRGLQEKFFLNHEKFSAILRFYACLALNHHASSGGIKIFITSTRTS